MSKTTKLRNIHPGEVLRDTNQRYRSRIVFELLVRRIHIAVKTQIWIAIAVYVLVAIVKKRLKTEVSLYKILQILSLALFEKTSLDQLRKKFGDANGYIAKQ